MMTIEEEEIILKYLEDRVDEKETFMALEILNRSEVIRAVANIAAAGLEPSSPVDETEDKER